MGALEAAWLCYGTSYKSLLLLLLLILLLLLLLSLGNEPDIFPFRPDQVSASPPFDRSSPVSADSCGHRCAAYTGKEIHRHVSNKITKVGSKNSSQWAAKIVPLQKSPKNGHPQISPCEVKKVFMF